MKFTLEVSTEINVSNFVAQQKANRFLIFHVGDQMMAGEPELVVAEKLFWRMPVHYAPSLHGSRGIVGYILVNTESGEAHLSDNKSPEQLLLTAEALHEHPAL